MVSGGEKRKKDHPANSDLLGTSSWEKKYKLRSGFPIWVPQIINRAVTGITTAVYLLLFQGSLAHECSNEEWPYKCKNAFLTKFTIKQLSII